MRWTSTAEYLRRNDQDRRDDEHQARQDQADDDAALCKFFGVHDVNLARRAEASIAAEHATGRTIWAGTPGAHLVDDDRPGRYQIVEPR